MSAIRKIQSQRVLFAIVSDILGIRDLAYLIEDYACRCEGHFLHKIPRVDTGYQFFDVEFHEMYHLHFSGIIRGFDLCGNPLHSFPCGFSPPTARMVCGVSHNRILWVNKAYEYILSTSIDQHRVVFGDFIALDQGCFMTSQGVWFNNDEVLIFHPWNAENDVIVSTECVESNIIDPRSAFMRSRHNVWQRVLIDPKDNSVQTIAMNPQPSFSFSDDWGSHHTFLADGSYLTWSGVNAFISSGLWVPEDWEQNQNGVVHRFVHPFHSNILPMFVFPQSGILLIYDHKFIHIYY
jgi:hypothetical protein